MSNLTEDQKLAKIKKFKAMGIPIPLEPILNPINTKASPEKLNMLEQIKKGSLKQDFNAIIAGDVKKSEFKPIGPAKPVKSPMQKPVTNIAKQTMTEANPEANAIENMLFGESGSVSNYTQNQTTINDSLNLENYMGAVPNNENKLFQLKQKIEMAKASQGNKPVTTTSEKNSKIINEIEGGHNSTYIGTPVMSEVEFTKKVTSIAIDVSKKMIKQVILEYVKDGKDIIVEGGRIKKAEIVAKNKVKIDGKVYRLTLDKE